jgi:hypothetical protein
VRLAARGQREDDHGDVSSQELDAAFDAAARRQARKVTMLSVATTVAVTTIALLIPSLH